MDEVLPDDYDVIIIGTGLTESIVSGALSRIGKKVLHLDHMKNYGSDWSSFNLKGFEERMTESAEPSADITNHSDVQHNIDENEEIFIPIGTIRQTVYNGSVMCHINNRQMKSRDAGSSQDFAENTTSGDNQETTNDAQGSSGRDHALKKDILPSEPSSDDVTDNVATVENEEGNVEKVTENTKPSKQEEQKIDKLSKEYFYSKWRHFNLDLTPKLMFSRGKLVELLIVSNVCRYLEFRNVTGTLTIMDEPDPKLVPVPCSRTDIFNSKLVTMVEKRLLMRILTTCANYENHPEEYKDFEDRPFIEFLASKRLSKKLQHFIIHSIAMVTEDTKTLDGLKASEKFLKSLGRYGNSAFLWTTYGVGELPQAFCRLGAVFGGTFCLNRFAHGIIVSKNSNRCIGIIDSTGQRLKCDQLILNECYAPESCRTNFSNKISRAVYVTDSPLAENGDGNACLISIPPMPGLNPTWLIEVSPSCRVCPPDMYVVHAMMRTGENDGSLESHFKKMEGVIFGGVGHKDHADPIGNGNSDEKTKHCKPKPNVLWSSYFCMANNGFDSTILPENVSIVKGPYYELGFDETIIEARSIFESISPNEEFLPRAPNPDEIVYFDQNDEGYNTETNGTESQAVDEIPGEYQEVENEVDSEAVEGAEQN